MGDNSDIVDSLSAEDINRIIEMAWEDRTPFDAILAQFGVAEQGVISLMRRELKAYLLAAVARAGTGPGY